MDEAELDELEYELGYFARSSPRLRKEAELAELEHRLWMLREEQRELDGRRVRVKRRALSR